MEIAVRSDKLNDFENLSDEINYGALAVGSINDSRCNSKTLLTEDSAEPLNYIP